MCRLTPKAFAVLDFLVARPGQLVSKDQLLAALWPDVTVSEAALTVCIREIRQDGLVRAIHGHTDGNPLFMVTVVEALVQARWLVPVEGCWEATRDLTAARAVLDELSAPPSSRPAPRSRAPRPAPPD